MAEKTLIVKVQADDKEPETLLVVSPAVGMADGTPRVGVFLNPFDRLITMKILNQRYVLRLPRDVHGRVTETFIPASYVPLGYGEPIVRLDPRALDAAVGGPAGLAGSGSTSGEEEDASLVTVGAPSEGIFYRRPSPDAPPFVDVGSPVTPGSMLGLVEIMKCFYQITYSGPGLPDKGEVVKILAEDSSEVRFGQPLFQVRSID